MTIEDPLLRFYHYFSRSQSRMQLQACKLIPAGEGSGTYTFFGVEQGFCVGCYDIFTSRTLHSVIASQIKAFYTGSFFHFHNYSLAAIFMLLIFDQH